jgi:hypothetical protein
MKLTKIKQEEILSVPQVAKRLRITGGRVRQLLLDPTSGLKGFKIGANWAVSKKEVERFAKLDRPVGNPNLLRKTS